MVSSKTNVRISALLRIVVCASVFFTTAPSSASAPEVYWSGFAYQGDFDLVERRYPNSKLLGDRKENGRSILDVRLQAAIQGIENDSFNIVDDRLGSLDPDAPSSIALAFVLDRETVSVEHIGSHYKLLVAISAQALFFDFKEKAVVSTFPMSLIYVDVQDSEPTEAEKAILVENLYLGSLKVNVIREFARILAAANLNSSVSSRIQVTNVAIDPGVVDYLPALWKNNLADFGVFVSQQFGRSLSQNQDVPVLPFKLDSAIGGRMSASFAQGYVYDLALPEPDYVISLSLEKLVKIEYAKVAAGTSFVYGSYLRVTAMEPLSRRIYFENTIKNGAVKTVPISQTLVDDWPAYQDSLLGLIDTFTAELGNPTKQWAKKHLGDESAQKQLSSFARVVQSCR